MPKTKQKKAADAEKETADDKKKQWMTKRS